MHTFFLAPEEWREPFTLRGTEAHHAAQVLRLSVGEELRLLDGQGREGVFCIERVSKKEITLQCREEIVHPQTAARSILAIGWCKAIRRSWLLEKAVELDCAELWFWQAERSQFPVPQDTEQWQSALIAGAKQCENPFIPQIRSMPGGVQQLMQAAVAIPHRIALWEEAEISSALGAPDLARGDTIYVIGPEGGITGREMDTLRAHDFAVKSLGRRVLRWETAALLCLGLHSWARQLRGQNSEMQKLYAVP